MRRQVDSQGTRRGIRPLQSALRVPLLGCWVGMLLWCSASAVALGQDATEGSASPTYLRSQVRVTGLVVHPSDGEPLPGAKIEAVSSTGERVSGLSDIEGSFVLNDLADGEWTITVTFAELEPVSTTVTVSADQVIDLRFTPSADQAGKRRADHR